MFHSYPDSTGGLSKAICRLLHRIDNYEMYVIASVKTHLENDITRQFDNPPGLAHVRQRTKPSLDQVCDLFDSRTLPTPMQIHYQLKS